MLAIDANLIVRYLTGDHPIQSAKARTLIDGNKVFVSTTVLLETEWVLRSVYLYTTVQLCTALRAFAGLSGVMLENAPLAAERLNGWKTEWISRTHSIYRKLRNTTASLLSTSAS